MTTQPPMASLRHFSTKERSAIRQFIDAPHKIICFWDSARLYFAVSTSAESQWPTSGRSGRNVEPFTCSRGYGYGDSGGLPLGEPPGGAASCISGCRLGTRPSFPPKSARAFFLSPTFVPFRPRSLSVTIQSEVLTGLRMKEAGRCGASVLRRLPSTTNIPFLAPDWQSCFLCLSSFLD